MTTPAPIKDERGAGLTLAAAMLTPAMFLCVGLVVDGARKTEAARQATSVAAAAARAGTDAEAASAVAGNPDPSAAYRAANSYLAASNMAGTVTLNGTTLTITTTQTTSTLLLSLIGIDTLTAHGHATATLEELPA